MSNIVCFYCKEPVPQHEYNSHIREKHATPTVQDLRNVSENYSRFYAMYHQRRTTPAAAAPHPPLSPASSSDTTLHESAADSGKMSTTFSAWQQKNKFAFTQSTGCVTAEDVSEFRVDRSDEPRTAARLLQKSTKYDIQEFVDGFRELGSGDRETCNGLVRRMPVFAVSGTSRALACFHAGLVSECSYFCALEIMRGRQAKVMVQGLFFFSGASGLIFIKFARFVSIHNGGVD